MSQETHPTGHSVGSRPAPTHPTHPTHPVQPPAAAGGAPNRRASGELEREVLNLLWSADEPLMPFQVQQRLGGGLAQSTVATTLLRLMDKGLADRAPRGKGFGYRALRRAEDHAAVQMVALVRRGENPDDVLRCFASQLPAGYQRVLREALTVSG
ncbi:BlaI/MecI/CopY family transcriptional regulator [Parafrankia elaeagni]|uniref:BlaI/MecI/CopY family transcriptional regulator n=1 Tax=Parafrankia elaeagni TaxID=222534 RepID=UPI00037C3709|nr:BlaI/MecI/CopY family transcriptional regulator [Parafrankia elaeagni]